MKPTDNYLTAIIGALFLLFASFESNPFSFTTSLIAAVIMVLIVCFHYELKKD